MSDPTNLNSANPEPAQSPFESTRLTWMLRVIFTLLVLHFVLVYTAPDWLMIPMNDRTSVFSAAGFRQAMPIGRGGGPRGPGGLGGAWGATVTERDGREYLRGGATDAEAFDITDRRFEPAGLHYGLGREAFPALIDPKFITVLHADTQGMADTSRVLLVQISDGQTTQTKVYPVDLLIRHEVVNDTVAGEPIFAAYCILADLGAVYSRQVGEHELTFGLSGYTYADRRVWNGLDAFVLWDRETESLWWPPIGRAVSGPMVDRTLPLLDETKWSQTTWATIKSEYPEALVLAPGQNFERPTPGSWPRLQRSDVRIDGATPPLATPPLATPPLATPPFAATQPATTQPVTIQRTGQTSSPPTQHGIPDSTPDNAPDNAPDSVPVIAPHWGDNATLGLR